MFIVTDGVQSHLQLLQVQLFQQCHRLPKTVLVSGRYKNLKKVIDLLTDIKLIRKDFFTIQGNSSNSSF